MEINNVISSEEDAIALLEQLSEGIELPADFVLEFHNWPSLTLRFIGEKYDQTVPTSMMPPILELQKEVHRLHCLLKYGEPNTRLLTDDDRKDTEILLKVEKGSSEFEALLEQPLEEIFIQAISRMTPEQITTTLITFALTYGSVTAWKAWLRHREAKAGIDNQVELSALEVKKMEVVAKASASVPDAAEVIEALSDIKNSVIKRVAMEDSLIISSEEGIEPIEVSGPYASDVTYRKRETSTVVRLDGLFIIHSVQSGNIDGYRLKVRRIEDHLDITVDVSQSIVTPSLKNLLKDNEWEKKAISMQINAKKIRGEIRGANLVSASKED